MIIIGFSNWKRKLKICILVVALTAILVSGYLLFGRTDLPAMGNADNDRDARGSLKVDAIPPGNAEAENWWGEFIETLKTYYQD